MKTKIFGILVSAFVALGFVISINVVFADSSTRDASKSQFSHPLPAGTPTPTPFPPDKYILPHNRNFQSVITNGPGEGQHTGRSGEAIDFSPRGWTSVTAAKTGTVYINLPDDDDWGNVVVLQHNDGFYTFYPHLAGQSTWAVNSQVLKGQTIGTAGDTGQYADGVHAHLELRDGMSGNNINTGSSVNHPVSRIPGVGLFPWYAGAATNPALNSGYVGMSTDHPVGKCLSDNTITVEWLNPNEYFHKLNNVDQIDGFSYFFTTSPEGTPPKTKIVEENVYQITSEPLAIGATTVDWYFHLRVKSVNDGWASKYEVSHQGPYKLNSTCPAAPTEGDWNSVPDDE